MTNAALSHFSVPRCKLTASLPLKVTYRRQRVILSKLSACMYFHAVIFELKLVLLVSETYHQSYNYLLRFEYEFLESFEVLVVTYYMTIFCKCGNFVKRGTRNKTGNRWRSKTFLVTKLDIFMSNLSTNRDRIKHFARGEIKHFSVESHH